MGVMVIACYKPKPAKEDALMALLKDHLPALREQGLVGDEPSLCGQAQDGTFVEVFVWKSQAAIDAAHENAVVAAMWEKFGAACNYTVIADVAGAKDLFTPLTPVDLGAV
ncbi:MAG: putative quinol monooxygenase [Hyphococcus sp.]